MILKDTLGMVFKSFETGSGESGNRIDKRISSKKNSLKKGFTLVELLVVLVILAILAAIAIPSLIGFVEHSKKKKCIEEGKIALSATQSMLSDAYTEGYAYLPTRVRNQAFTESDLPASTRFTVYTVDKYTKGDGTYKTIGSYSVKSAIYKSKDNMYAYFDGKDWTVVASNSDKVSNEFTDNYIVVWGADDKASVDTASVIGESQASSGTDPENDDDHKTEEDYNDNNGGNENSTEEEVSTESAYSVKVVMIAEGAEREDGTRMPYLAKFLDGTSTFRTTFSQSDKMLVKPAITYNTFAYLASENSEIKWVPDIAADKSFSTVDEIEEYLTSIVAQQNGKTITFNLSLTERSINVPVAFKAYNKNTLKVDVDTAKDTDGDNLKDTITMSYGIASKEVTTDFDLAKVHYTPAPAGYDEVNDAGAIDFDGNWALMDEEAKNGTKKYEDYKRASDISEIKNLVSEYVSDNLIDQNEESVQNIENGGVELDAPADIKKTAYIRGTMKNDTEYTGKVQFLPISEDDASGEPANANATDAESTDSDETDEVFHFEVEFTKNELENKIYDIKDGKENKKIVDFTSEENSYSVFDSNKIEVSYDEALKLKSWQLFNCDKDGSEQDDEYEKLIKEEDCTKELIEKMYDDTTKDFGEVAEIDVSDMTTRLKTDLNKGNTWARECFKGIADTTVDKIVSITYIPKDSVIAEEDIYKEVCLSTTKVRTSGTNANHLAREDGEYKVEEEDRDPLYPGYTIAYSTKFTDGGVDYFHVFVVTEDDTRIYADGSLRGLHSNFAVMETNTFVPMIDTADVTDMSEMFKNCKELTGNITLDISSVTSLNNTFNNAQKLTSISMDAGENGAPGLSNVSSCFSGTHDLQNVSFTNVNSSSLTSLSYLFGEGTAKNRDALTTVNMSGFNTGNINNFSNMFLNCRFLTSVTVSESSSGDGSSKAAINISNATNLNSMFKGASSLTEINLDAGENGAPNLSNVSSCFSGTHDLQKVSFTNVNSNDLTSLSYLFGEGNAENRDALTTVDLSGFNTERINNFSSMFLNCRSLNSVIGLENSEGDGGSKIIINIANATNLNNMFKGASSLTEIYLDAGENGAPNLSNIDQMFSSTRSLQKVAFKNVNSNNLTSISYLFGTQNASDRTALSEIDLSGFDTTRINNFSYMLYNCSKLTKITTDYKLASDGPLFARFRIDSATDLTNMFYGAGTINGIGLQGSGTTIDTGLTTFKSAFANCNALTTISITDLKSTAISSVSSLFENRSSLTSVTLSNLLLPNVTDLSAMFKGCSNLSSIDLSDFKCGKVASTANMFNECSGLTTLNIAGLDTSETTNMNAMFRRCSSMTTIDISALNTKNATDMGYMFSGCSGITSIADVHIDSATNIVSMFNECSKLTTVTFVGGGNSSATPTALSSGNDKMKNIFNGCTQLTTVNVKNLYLSNLKNITMFMNGGTNVITTFNVSNVTLPSATTMKELFKGNKIIKTINITNMSISDLDTDTIDASYMFSGCTELLNVTLNNLNVSKVTNVSYMFDGDTKISGISFTSLDTSKVQNMSHMFNNCQALTSLNLSCFNTSNVTDMSYMFNRCSNLTNVNVSSFDTSKVKTMQNMFGNSDGGANKMLKTLDLSSFSTVSLKMTRDMFLRCNSLETVYVNPEQWNYNLVHGIYADRDDQGNGSCMFKGCGKLKGQNGTKVTNYNSNNEFTSSEYAVVDEKDVDLDGDGVLRKGYFSLKNTNSGN